MSYHIYMTRIRESRSAKYQYIFNELQVDEVSMLNYFNEDGLHYNGEYNEIIMDLQEDYNKRLWVLLRENLTENQLICTEALAEGLTQDELAKKLGLNQSSINKTMWGNVVYGDGEPVHYGGVRRKMQAIAKDDEELMRIKLKILDLI